MSETFDAAVEWLTVLSAEYVKNGKLILPRTEPRRNIHMLMLGIYWIPDDLDGQPSRNSGHFHCSNDAAEKLLNISETDAAAFDLCKEIAAHRLVTDGEFLPALKTFTSLYMIDQIKRPATTRKSVTWLRNMFLLTMAKVTSKSFELPLTRGDATKHRKSACDAVVTALSKNNHAISFRAVKELCVGTGSENVALRKEFEEWVYAQMVAIERDEIASQLFHRTWMGVGFTKIPPS